MYGKLSTAGQTKRDVEDLHFYHHIHRYLPLCLDVDPAAMSILDSARQAEDRAAGFNKFVDQVPEEVSRITGVVSELFGISAALRDLDGCHRSVQYRRRFGLIMEDVELVIRSSLRHTMRDIFDLFGPLGISSNLRPSQETYRRVWRELWSFFLQQSGQSLVSLLKMYRKMLEEMVMVVKG